MKRKVLEKDIQKTILDYLKRKGIFHWRNNTGAQKMSYKGKARYVRFGVPGSPDIYAVKNGFIHGIEVKGSDGHLSEDQRQFLREFARAGGCYILAYDLRDVTPFL